MVTVPNFALQVERTGSIYWQAYFCTVCVYFLFPQHHGNDRFYTTSMGQYKPTTSLNPLVCLTLPKWRPWVYVKDYYAHGSLVVGGWAAPAPVWVWTNFVTGGQTSGQQSATRALPRTGRGRLPHTERVIPNKNFTYEIKVAWKYCNCLLHGPCG